MIDFNCCVGLDVLHRSEVVPEDNFELHHNVNRTDVVVFRDFPPLEDNKRHSKTLFTFVMIWRGLNHKAV